MVPVISVIFNQLTRQI